MAKLGITIKHLVFTRAKGSPAELVFDDGLNIVYGASDTGKSFSAQAILFMLGASTKLPPTPEITRYQAVLLGLELPDGRLVTLYRSTKGGDFRLHDGLRTDVDAKSGEVLLGKADPRRTDTVSNYLLSQLGLAGKEIVRTANAEKDALTIRLLAPFAIVGEEDILSKRSPVLTSGQFSEQTLERNLFRMLLTGNDDSSVVTVTSSKTRATQNSAKIELLDEMIAQLDSDLGETFDEKTFDAELESVTTATSSSYASLERTQNRLDDLGTERRTAIDTGRELAARLGELEITLERFRSLSAVYSQDIARLEALEEGGFILRAMSSRDCAICGAPPSAQRHNHAAEDIERAYKAARAESIKLQVERLELEHTTASLQAEAEQTRSILATKRGDLELIENEIALLRPMESTFRSTYEKLATNKARVDRITELVFRRSALQARRSQLEKKTPAPKAEKLEVGVQSTLAFEFGKVIREVLVAWNFPDGAQAQFDLETNDIMIGGKPRAASGKGVRAILHAAFNVALLLFCHRRGLSHPRFLVLDTPLLTYREPLTSKHGELSDDESAMAKSDVATSFYKHLAEIKQFAQIIVLENATPPQSAGQIAKIEVFSGKGGAGRQALFPMSDS